MCNLIDNILDTMSSNLAEDWCNMAEWQAELNWVEDEPDELDSFLKAEIKLEKKERRYELICATARKLRITKY